jgi:hypothetical protein
MNRIRVKRDPLLEISATERREMRKRHDGLYKTLDRYVHLNEMTGAELHCGVVGMDDPMDGGTMLAICTDIDISEIVHQQMRDIYFKAGDHITGNARIAAHRVLDQILNQMQADESQIGTLRFETQQDEVDLQIVVTAGDPYSSSLQDYVGRLIFLEVNSEQLMPARRPSANIKPLVN